MEFTEILGMVAAGAALLNNGAGVFSQVIKNMKNKSVEGFSLFFAALLFFTMTAWLAYGIVLVNWYLIVPNILGFICTLMLLLQFWWYGKKG